MYHYNLGDAPTVVIASNTDILILTVHVFASCLTDHDWFLQTNKNELVNVSKIFDYIGKALVTNTSRKTIFPKFWNIMESSKRPSKHNLPFNFLAQKRPYFTFPKRSKQELFSNQ